MLSHRDLLNLDKIPDESEISLESYAKFYNEYIANRTYIIKLYNAKEIDLCIAPGHLSHIIGLHKYKAAANDKVNRLLKDPYNLNKFQGYLNIFNNKITLNDLKLIRGKSGLVYNLYKDRILAMPFIYQLIRTGSFMEFDPSKVIGGTKIPGEYMFVDDKGNDKLHLFIKHDKDTFYPISLITRNNSLSSEEYNYYVNNQTVLNILKIEVYNNKNKSLLEIITPGKIHSIPHEEVAAAADIKTKIINLYKSEFPNIKYISEDSAEIIYALNKEHGKALTIKEIKQQYENVGKKLENIVGKSDFELFNKLNSVVNDFKQAKLMDMQQKTKVNNPELKPKSNNLEIGD